MINVQLSCVSAGWRAGGRKEGASSRVHAADDAFRHAALLQQCRVIIESVWLYGVIQALIGHFLLFQ